MLALREPVFICFTTELVFLDGFWSHYANLGMESMGEKRGVE